MPDRHRDELIMTYTALRAALTVLAVATATSDNDTFDQIDQISKTLRKLCVQIAEKAEV